MEPEANSARRPEYRTSQRIDMACDVFESDWQAGKRPDISAQLSLAAAVDRIPLFKELLKLDCDYRQRTGENPTAAEYFEAFPDYREQIADVFGMAASAGSNSIAGAKTLFQSLGSLGVYQLLEKLGQGGMGAVYKARHQKLKRIVAIKVLPKEARQHQEAIARFEREMEVIGALDHPNIVRAMDAGEESGTHFLAMEYVAGQDLGKVLSAQGPFALDRALDCISQVAEGMAYVHEQGIVHRDLKPANLLLDAAGTVKILDLGLARLECEVNQQTTALLLTQAGQVMGTYDYMSPEQAIQSRDVDHRTDIYSLGCTLFVLLTGQPMYGGETPIDKVLAHRSAPLPSLRSLRPDVSEELDVVFRKMVAKSPADRYATMNDVVAALDGCASKMPGAASQLSVVTKAMRPMLLRWLAPGLVALLSLVALGWGWFQFTNQGLVRIDSFDPKLPVELLRNGSVIAMFPAGDRSDFQSYPAGSYELRLKQPQDQVRIEGALFALDRGGRKWVRITPIPLPEFLTSAMWAWTSPQHLGVVNSMLNDQAATVSCDETELIFSSARTGGFGELDLWHCSRANKGDDWSSPTNLGPLINTAGAESEPELSSDGLTLIFASDCVGGRGDWDLWSSQRTAVDQPWSAPANLGTAINTAGKETGAALSSDGLNLVFASNRSGGNGDLDLWHAQRASVDVPFATASNLGPAINSSGTDSSPSLSADGGVLVFASVRSGGSGRSDLWICTRNNSVSAWGQPHNAGPYVNTVGNELEPTISADGNTLYYSTIDLPGGRGGSDLCVSRRVSKASIPEPPLAPRTLVDSGTVPQPNENHSEPVPVIPEPPLAVAPFDAVAARDHQSVWAKHLGVPIEKKILIAPQTEMAFVMIPAGEYLMGSSTADIIRLLNESKQAGIPNDVRIHDETPQHLVTITKPFYFSKYEVTRAQWLAVMDPEGQGTNPDHPRSLSWNEAELLLRKFNEDHRLRGWKFQFPTEAQWEYACRAGSTTDFSFGNEREQLFEYAWFTDNEPGKAQVVGQLKPNPWGLYDVHGNMCEWMLDLYNDKSYATSGQYDPPGSLQGITAHVLRGGSWKDPPRMCRSAVRRSLQPEVPVGYGGLRMVLTPARNDFSLLREPEPAAAESERQGP